METTAKEPGYTGSPQDGRAVDGHVHHLLALAEALATSAATRTDPKAFVAAPLGVELASLTDNDVAAWSQTLEHLNRFLQGLIVHTSGELAERISAGRYQESGARTPADFLSSSLKLSRAEANNRLRLAQRFLPSTDPLTHVETEPSQQTLGSALFSGKVSIEQALVVSGFVDKASHLAKSGVVDAQDVSSLESTLSEHAEVEPPYFLRHLGIRALALLDPDGEKPSESQRLAKQGLSFHRPYKGWVRMDGYLTINQYEQTMACIDWATNPKRADNQSEESSQSPTENEATPGGSGAPGSRADDSGAKGTGAQPPQETLLRTLLGDTGTGPSAPTTGPGWRRRLNPDEIPPRPPDAPPHASPPVHEGDSWFWIPGIPDPGPQPSPKQWPPPASHAAQETAENSGWSGSDLDDTGYLEEGGSADGSSAESTEPWPHLINGVSVPAPGSEDALPGLSPIDPDSTDPAVKDRRTRAQMLLDGMLHCLAMAAGTGKLPLNGGLKTQLYLSLTQDDLDCRKGAGSIDSPYSGQVPLALFNEEVCSAEVTEVLRDSNGAILDVGRTQRLFTFAQRKILVARDMGCVFPDCMAPPQWTQAHHIIPWQDGGPTSIDNGVLCCSLHHHYLHDRGWTVRLDGGTAWFTPPWSEDMTRRERRNTYHHDRGRH